MNYMSQKKGYTIQDLKKDMMSSDTYRHIGQVSDIPQVGEYRQWILNYLRKQGPTPQVTLAKITGLSRTTISNIIGDLKNDGWVWIDEGDQLDTTDKVGRKPTPIRFKADAGYVIGIDIGRSHLTILLTDLQAGQIGRWSGAFDSNLVWRDCLKELVKQVQSLLDSSNVKLDKVIGIGVGIPGTLDPQLRRLTKPALMPTWEGIDIPRELQRKLKIPVYLDNDANMGALGESRYGRGKAKPGASNGIANLVYVKVGTGVGAGLIIGGHLYRGSRGTAGELGHMKVGEDGPQSENCRNYGCPHGCLESLAAEQAILEDAHYDTFLKDNQPALARSADDDEHIMLEIAKVVQAAKNGDEASRAALEGAGKRIGRALGNLINLFDPEMIVLDGGVIRAGDELLLTPLYETAKNCSLPPMKGDYIVPGELGEDASAHGAVATVIDAIDIAFTQNKAIRSLELLRK